MPQISDESFLCLFGYFVVVDNLCLLCIALRLCGYNYIVACKTFSEEHLPRVEVFLVAMRSGQVMAKFGSLFGFPELSPVLPHVCVVEPCHFRPRPPE